MTYVVVLVIFAILFFMDFQEIKKANLKEKVVYGLLFLGALSYALLYEANITSSSVISFVARAVGFIRGVDIPPQFY